MQTRRYPRFPVDLPVTLVKFWEETPIAKTNGRCHVLAEGGLSATVAAHDLYIGEVVRLEVPRVVRLYASVRDARGSQYGFQFVYMDEQQRRAIRRFCEACAADSDQKLETRN